MKIDGSGHTLFAEARRHIWAVRPEFWDSFHRLITADRLTISGLPEPAKVEIAQAAPSRSAGRREKKAAVAVIPLQGLITPKASILSFLFGAGGTGLQAFRQSLRDAARDEDISAIVLDVDSPGGSSALVEEAAADIRMAREVKPVVAVANVDAGSAAYWLASQASELSVTPSGMVGSIGAYILHLDFAGMNEAMGVEPTYVFAGRNKVEANPDEPLDEAGAAYLQGIVDDCYARFVRDVATGRGVTEKAVRSAAWGEGRMLTSDDALEAGMVDRVETLESAIGRALEEPSSIPSGAGGKIAGAIEAEVEASDEVRLSRKAREKDQALIDSVIAG